MSQNWRQPTVWISIVGFVIMLGTLVLTHGRNLEKLDTLEREVAAANEKLERVLISDGAQQTQIDRNTEELRSLWRAVQGREPR